MRRNRDTRRTPRQKLTALFAVACLAFGWAHVWLHDAGHDRQGHFGTEAGASCPLAQLPPQILPDVPACTAPARLETSPAAEPRIVFARDAVRRPGVRAPPLS